MKLIDKYEGCEPRIAEALRAGMICLGVWCWDECDRMADLYDVCDYIAGEVGYKTTNPGVSFVHASPDNPQEKPPAEEVP